MAAAPQLPALPSAIALFHQHIAQHSTTLVLREKMLSLSGDSFSISTVPGNTPIFSVSGSAFSLSGRKTISDTSGTPLFDIRKEHFKIPSTYYAETPNDEKKIFEVKGKFSLGSSKAVGVFEYQTQQGQRKAASLMMKGDFFDRKADITDEETGSVVGRIDRQFLNARELVGGQQTYAVTVAPGMDMAVVVAMCICLDERQNEK